MSYEIYTEYPCQSREDVRKIVGDDRAPYTELEDVYTRIELLAPSIVERCKEYAKSGHFKYGGGYKSLVYDSRGPSPYTKGLIQPALNDLEAMNLYPPKVNVEALPCLSFFLQIHFSLLTPCHTGGEETFYIHESPLLKDKVFKVPILPASSWKGVFRGVGRRLIVEGEDQRVYDRLFGTALGEVLERELVGKGRLYFYPSLFDRIGLDVINPHSRRTKAGTLPILEEIVPPGARGVFSLLYVPTDLLASPDKARAEEEAKEDLTFTVKVLKEVLHTYGFSANSTRGFGLAADRYVKSLGPTKQVAGGFIEMAGVPVYEAGEKDNTFMYPDQLDRIARKMVERLPK